MYILVYPPFVFVSVLLYGPPGIFSAWFTILHQSGAVALFVVTVLLMPEIQKIAFDAVLSREYADNIVLQGKLRRIVKVPFFAKFGVYIFAIPTVLIVPYILLKALVMLLISTIPFVGPILVVLIQAPSRGLQAHARYFVLKAFEERQIIAIYKANTGDYMGFGLVANFLEAMPLFSVFFMFTNTIGAALWVIDIEKEESKKNSTNLLISPKSIGNKNDELTAVGRDEAPAPWQFG